MLQLHVQYSDCRNLIDHFLSPTPKQVQDNRLSIELAGLRETLWEDDIPSHAAIAPYGDILRWITTCLLLADCFTNHKVNEAASSKRSIQTDIVIFTVIERAAEASTSEQPASATTAAEPRHSSEGHAASSEAIAQIRQCTEITRHSRRHEGPAQRHTEIRRV